MSRVWKYNPPSYHFIGRNYLYDNFHFASKKNTSQSLLYPNWSERKMFSEKCIVMVMRHRGGWGISPTALENSDRHNLCRISRVSTGRLICKTELLSTDSLSFYNAIGIKTTKINNKSTFIARFKARKVRISYSNCDHLVAPKFFFMIGIIPFGKF
jgi:hypothetical protein